MINKTRKNYFITQGEKNTGPTMVLTGHWNKKLIKVLKKEKINNIRLSRSAGWLDKDISFLKDISFIIGVEIYADDINDLRVLHNLDSLEYLGLMCEFSYDLDLSYFRRLRVLQINWDSHVKNLTSITSLEFLNIINYPFNDLLLLGNMSNLKELKLTSTKLKSLEGINELSYLETLDLFKCKKLEDLSILNKLSRLELVELDSCKKINNIDSLADLINLKTLLIDNCGEIDTILPLLNNEELKKIFISGDTKIKDGKIKELLVLPHLKDFFFVNRRNYNIKQSEVKKLLKE